MRGRVQHSAARVDRRSQHANGVAAWAPRSMKRETRVGHGEHEVLTSATSWTIQIPRPPAAPALVVPNACNMDSGISDGVFVDKEDLS